MSKAKDVNAPIQNKETEWVNKANDSIYSMDQMLGNLKATYDFIQFHRKSLQDRINELMVKKQENE